MADELQFNINDSDLRAAIATLKSLGDGAKDVIQKIVDFGAVEIAKHAKSSHFFVGMGKGSAAVAEENVFTFANPDGTPRFKIRTGNLLNSIQEIPGQMVNGIMTAKVYAGMEYAQDVEYGTPKTRAFPFMRPAVEAKREEVVSKAIDYINNVVRENGGEG